MSSSLIYGAIIGDIYGSAYEFSSHPNEKAPSLHSPLLFENRDYTDDTVRTRAVLSALEQKTDIAATRRSFAKKYPPKKGGFGSRFQEWLDHPNRGPYHSYGNGAGRRISPVSYFSSSLEECDQLAFSITSLTHDSKEGIKAGCLIADLIYLALNGYSKEQRKDFALSYYPGFLSFQFDVLHETYIHTAKAEDSVPEALFCFFQTHSFQECLHSVCYIGGDADTIGARSLSIASAYYKSIPQEYLSFADSKLPKEFIALLRQAPCKTMETSLLPIAERIKRLPSYLKAVKQS